MQVLKDVLNAISNALLAPVIRCLLFLLGWILVMGWRLSQGTGGASFAAAQAGGVPGDRQGHLPVAYRLANGEVVYVPDTKQ